MTKAAWFSRSAMWLGLVAVAAAAAVLSFTALRDLARLCSFGSWSWLLPVVVDAGAASASLVWMGRWAPRVARSFARALALALLGSSVAGNALSHGMTAAHVVPHWTVVVAVSAVAPIVLGSVVHLAVLATDREDSVQAVRSGPDQSVQLVADSVSAPVRTVADVITERADTPAEVPVQPGPDRPRRLTAVDPDRSVEFRAWAATLDERPSEYAVRKRFGCRQSVAQRLLAELDDPADEDARESVG